MEVLLFGITKDIAGKQKLIIPPDEVPVTVGKLRDWLCTTYPDMADLRSLAIAVNSEVAPDDQLLLPEYEIALIPPVSGG